jgi:trehalose/maltose hydrolase-like predicted phosphorylase
MRPGDRGATILSVEPDVRGAESAHAPPASGPEALAQRFEAVIFAWSAGADPGGHTDLGRLRGLVEEGSSCGLEIAIVSRAPTRDVDSQLKARPVGPGGLILAVESGSEIYAVGRTGPRQIYGRGAAARRAALVDGEAGCVGWITGWLWRCGVAPEQVLVIAGEPGCAPAGTICVGGRAEAFAAVLEDQIARRRRGELPILVQDPAWTIAVDGIDPRLERAHESVLTLADGRLGTRGSVIVSHASEHPAVVMAGVYGDGRAETRLLAAPRWNTITLAAAVSGPVRRVLDLHSGVLRQQIGHADDRVDALLLSSLAEPATAVLRMRGRPRPRPGALAQPAGRYEEGEAEGCRWIRVRGHQGSVVAAACEELRSDDSGSVLDRVAVYEGTSNGHADVAHAAARAREADGRGFDRLLCEHRHAWGARWQCANVMIDGDPDLERAVRFAVFQLLANVADRDEAAVGARGLTGTGYGGHVFWDSDVYVLPCLAAIHPAAARAMLEYRIRRLPAAMRAARAQRRDGARFPWESARSGQDVTPKSVRDPRGRPVEILTGRFEEHIVADVAWAAACYVDWTGDRAFARAQGRELILQTARWWASGIERDAAGRGHIRGVMGPDEYHPRVDDNAFTNVMARWNLRYAAQISAGRVDETERHRWLELADSIVDGYDPRTGLYEQFAGFDALEPLLISEIADRRPVAADVLLGEDRVRHAQVIKQPDVLMLHYLVPDEVAAGSLEPNLNFYEPRTAHGSTLSPGVHATLLARARHLELALDMLRLTARIDLDDVSHMTAGGLHLAAMGSVWRTLVYGFAGLRPAGDALTIDPVLAPGWEALDLRLGFRGSRVRTRITPAAIEMQADPPIDFVTATGERIAVGRTRQKLGRHPAPRRRSP